MTYKELEKIAAEEGISAEEALQNLSEQERSEVEPRVKQKGVLENLGRGALKGASDLGLGTTQLVANLLGNQELADTAAMGSEMREAKDRYGQRDGDITYLIGQVLGQSLPLAAGGAALGGGAKIAQAPGYMNKVMRGAQTGAKYGAASSAVGVMPEGSDIINRAAQTAGGAVFGAGLGAAVPLVIGAPRKLAETVFGRITPEEVALASKLQLKNIPSSERMESLKRLGFTKEFDNELQSIKDEVGSKILESNANALSKIANGKLIPKTKEEVGQFIRTQSSGAIESIRKHANKLYDDVYNVVDKGAEVPFNKIAEYINTARKSTKKYMFENSLADKIAKELEDLQATQGGVSFETLRGINSSIKEKSRNTKALMTSFPNAFGNSGSAEQKAFLDKLSTAIDGDLDNVVGQYGEDALNNWKKANNFYAAMQQDIIKPTSKFMKSDLTGQEVHNAIFKLPTSMDPAKIRKMLVTLPPEDKQMLSRHFIDHYGVNKATGAFDPDQFYKGFWDKIKDDDVKNIMFSKDQQNAINGLKAVIQKTRAFDKLGNPNQGFNVFSKAIVPLLGGAFGGVAGGLTGNLAVAGAGAAAGVGAARSLGSRLITAPKFINWLAAASKMPNEKAFAVHLRRLAKIASVNPELREDIFEYMRGFSAKGEYLPPQQGEPTGEGELATNDQDFNEYLATEQE